MKCFPGIIYVLSISQFLSKSLHYFFFTPYSEKIHLTNIFFLQNEVQTIQIEEKQKPWGSPQTIHVVCKENAA